MASETQSWPRPFPPMEAWPPDDTEESILGTDLHQTTITNLRWGINEVARLNREPGQLVPWKALSQIALLGCVRPDGSAYRTYPDVFVYPRPIEPDRGALTLAVDGPPVLIIEVLSESTYEADIDLVRGKGYSYARAGVREYLALDPTGAFLPEQGHGWHLVDGVYRSWEPDATGRWQSAEIAVAIGLEGTLATVYTREGKRLLHEGEVEEELARRDETITRQAAEIEELRRQLRELRREQ
jgi:putative restriction endonuclease